MHSATTSKQIKWLSIWRVGKTQGIHLEDACKKLLVPLHGLSWPRPHLRADETDITTGRYYLPRHNPHLHRNLPKPSLLNKNGININKTLRRKTKISTTQELKLLFDASQKHRTVWYRGKHQQSIGSTKPIQNSTKPRTTQQSNPPKDLIFKRTQFFILRFTTINYEIRLRNAKKLKSWPLIEWRKATEEELRQCAFKDAILQQILMEWNGENEKKIRI